MANGETSPEQLYASVYGQPVNPELLQAQAAQLESLLAQAEDRGNPEEIESIQEQLRQLREAGETNQ